MVRTPKNLTPGGSPKPQRQDSLVQDDFMRSDDFTEVYSQADEHVGPPQQLDMGDRQPIDQQMYRDMTPPKVERDTNYQKQLLAQKKRQRANTCWLFCLSAFLIALLAIAIGILSLNSKQSQRISDIKEKLVAGGLLKPDVGKQTVTTQNVPLNLGQDGYVISYQPQENMKVVSSLTGRSGYWNTQTRMPQPRSDFQAVIIPNIAKFNDLAGQVLLVGGHDDYGNYLNTTVLYDPVMDAFKNFVPMPQNRTKMAAVQVGIHVLVIGGYENKTQENDLEPEAGIFELDLELGNAWIALDNVYQRDSRMKYARSDFCAAAVGTKVYAIGGAGKGRKPLSSIEEYDYSTGKWRMMSATLPSARADVACTSQNGKVYIAGGNTGTDYTERFQKELLEFDPATDTLRKLASVKYPRGDAQLVALPRNRLLFIGGEYHYENKRGQVALHYVEEYLADHDVWVERPPLAEARFRFAALSMDEGVWVFGGHPTCITGWPSSCYPDALNSVEAFYDSSHTDLYVLTGPDTDVDSLKDPKVSLDGTVLLKDKPTAQQGYLYSGSLREGAGYWSRVALLQQRLRLGLSDYGLVAINDNEVIIFGGLSQKANLRDPPQYNKATYKINVVTGDYDDLEDAPDAFHRAAVTILDGIIYVVGGFLAPADEESFPELNTQVHIFNVATKSWSILSRVKPIKNRSDACAVAYRKKIYVMGGYDEQFNWLDSVEVFDPAKPANGFQLLDTNVPTGRGDLKCTVYGDDIYVVGGVGHSELPDNVWGNRMNEVQRSEVETYNGDTKRWQRVADLPLASGDMALVTIPGSGIMALGGETYLNSQVTNVARHQVFEYLADSDIWVQRAPLPKGRFRFDGAYVNGAVHVFGGQSTCNGTLSVLELESYQCPTSLVGNILALEGSSGTDVFAYVMKQ